MTTTQHAIDMLQEPRLPESDVAQRVIDGLVGGLPMTFAAEYAGVSAQVVYDWLRRGEQYCDALNIGTANEQDAPYYRFFTNLRVALAERSLTEVANIRRLSRNDWRGSAWLLSRWHPNEFGNKAVLEHQGTTPVQHQVIQPTDKESLQEVLKVLEEAGAYTPKPKQIEAVADE